MKSALMSRGVSPFVKCSHVHRVTIVGRISGFHFKAHHHNQLQTTTNKSTTTMTTQRLAFLLRTTSRASRHVFLPKNRIPRHAVPLSHALNQHAISQARLFSSTNNNRPAGLPDDVEYEDKTLPRPILDPSDYTNKIPVRMPDMGQGHGKILRWYVAPGDVVLREDVLCDIETPDFVFGMETEDEHPAIMGEILVQAPSGEVKDEDIICYLLHPSTGNDKTQKSE